MSRTRIPPLGLVLLAGLLHGARASAQTATPTAIDPNLNPTANIEPSGQPDNAYPSSDSAARAKELNVSLGYHGWDVPFPSFADSLVQDNGGVRSALAKYGFGFLVYNLTTAEGNLLNTARSIPSSYEKCPAYANEAGSTCAGNRSYFGQRFDVYNSTSTILTYDASRLGIPDGLLTIGASFSQSTDLAYSPEIDKVNIFSYYQTLFNKRAEIEFGILEGSSEFIGQTVGGNYASVFGPSGTIPNQLGLSGPNAGTPMFRTTIHITGDIKNGFYDEFGVARSLPVNSFTTSTKAIYPGAFENENATNPTGLNFRSSVPGTGALFIDEVGYRRESQTGQTGQWFRAGSIYNTSKYRDLSEIATNPYATTNGSYGSVYVLADQQVLQTDASRPGRGLYVGGTYMYASPKIASFTQYEEARIYMKGPIDSRPDDQLSLIYDRNTVSPYILNTPFSYNPVTNLSTSHFNNSVDVVYVARLRPGAYLSLGLGYTDHPSVRAFSGEGSALNFLGGVFLVL